MESFIEEAIHQAKCAFSQEEVPIGAVIVKENTIIAKAHNSVETYKDASAHAEMLALKSATEAIGDFRIGGTLICTLEPCIMCAGAIILHRIEHVIYLAKDFRHGAHGSIIDVFADKHPIHNPTITYLEGYPIAHELLTEFFQRRRRHANKRSNAIRRAISNDDRAAKR